MVVAKKRGKWVIYTSDGKKMNYSIENLRSIMDAGPQLGN